MSALGPLLIFLRLGFPLTILRWPLAGVLGSIVLDNLDWFVFNVRTETEYLNYQLTDKLLDTYFLSLALIVAMRWKEMAAKAVAFWAFTYRLIGVALYWLTQSEPLLILFPNYFETFFIFYLIYRLFRKTELLFNRPLTYLVVIPLTLIPKLIHELIHLTSDVDSPLMKSFYENRDIIIYGGYFLFLPLALIWRLRQKKGTG